MATGRRRKQAARLQLRLYIAGRAPNSLHALTILTALCEERGRAMCDLEVVDMLDDPRRALADGVLVTPTLIRLRPLPVQRIIGSLGDASLLQRVLAGK